MKKKNIVEFTTVYGNVENPKREKTEYSPFVSMEEAKILEKFYNDCETNFGKEPIFSDSVIKNMADKKFMGMTIAILDKNLDDEK